MNRYNGSPLLNGGKKYGTSDATYKIRQAISLKSLPFREVILAESQRLDIISGIEYGDSTLWWVIAAASNIGWGLQVPPGISIRIPDINKVMELI